MKSQWKGEVLRGLVTSFNLRNGGKTRQDDMDSEHCAGVGCVLEFLLERTIDYGWPTPFALFRQPNEIRLNPCRILRIVFPVHNQTHSLIPPGIFIADLTQALGKTKKVNYGEFGPLVLPQLPTDSSNGPPIP